MVSKFKNIKFSKILPRDSQSIEPVIDTRCVFRAKKKDIIKKIVFPYDHLVSVTLKYHRISHHSFVAQWQTIRDSDRVVIGSTPVGEHECFSSMPLCEKREVTFRF